MDDNKTASNQEKNKALAIALAQIEKQFGKGSIMRMAPGVVVEEIPAVSTGSLGLDIALVSVACLGDGLSRFTARNLQVKRR